MSSSNMRKKEYAKKLLKKHVSSFRKDDTLENKYSILSNSGMTKVDDKLIKYITKETGLSSLQATDLVVNEYNDSRDKLNAMKKDNELKKKDYIDRYMKEKRKHDKEAAYKAYSKNNSIETRNSYFNQIDKNNYIFEKLNKLRENNDLIQSSCQILQEMEFLIENYDMSVEEAFDLISEGRTDRTSESFIRGVKEEYSRLKKERPALAAAIKGFVYPYLGAVGGFIHGTIKYDRELNKKNGNDDPYIILKQTLKGYGYTLLAQLITPVGTAALSVISQKRKDIIRKKYGVYKEDGELYIENDILYSVMKENNIPADDAINLIMESYEKELYNDDINL